MSRLLSLDLPGAFLGAEAGTGKNADEATEAAMRVSYGWIRPHKLPRPVKSKYCSENSNWSSEEKNLRFPKKIAIFMIINRLQGGEFFEQKLPRILEYGDGTTDPSATDLSKQTLGITQVEKK